MKKKKSSLENKNVSLVIAFFIVLLFAIIFQIFGMMLMGNTPLRHWVCIVIAAMGFVTYMNVLLNLGLFDNIAKDIA